MEVDFLKSIDKEFHCMTEMEINSAKRLKVEVCKLCDAQEELPIYREFYLEAEQSSPFLCPSLVALYISEIGFIKVTDIESGKIWWMQPFIWESRSINFQFFGETHTDYICLLFANGLSHLQKSNALEIGLKAINFRRFSCKKLKLKSEDTSIFMEVLAKLGFTAYAYPYIASPIASYQLEDELEFKKIFSKSTIRNLHNRLQKQAILEFEVIETYSSLVDLWLNDYYLLHEWRWSTTPTPSRFLQKDEKLDFKKRVTATLSDGKSVLFSLKVDGKRQALVYALKAENRLIYHQIANGQDPKLYKFSLYKILIKQIGEWMREKQYTILDFGIGGETYKMEFATAFEQVADIYASPNEAAVLIKGAIRKYYLSHKQVQKYFLKAREFFNKSKAKFRHSFLRAKQLRQHIFADPLLYLKKLIAMVNGKRVIFFQMPSTILDEQDSTFFGQPTIESILDFYDKEILTSPVKRGCYIRAYLIQEKIPWAIFGAAGEIKCLGWSANATDKDVLPASTSKEDCVVLSDFLTSKKERGKGLYPLLLKSIAASFPNKILTIYTADWNLASQKGIQKAGFQRFR